VLSAAIDYVCITCLCAADAACPPRRVLEGGDLSALLKRRGRALAVTDARNVALRVLTGVNNMHKVAGICHASLKPDNIGLLRAGDFGSTVVFDIATWQPLDWRPSLWGVPTVLEADPWFVTFLMRHSAEDRRTVPNDVAQVDKDNSKQADGKTADSVHVGEPQGPASSRATPPTHARRPSAAAAPASATTLPWQTHTASA